MDHGSKRYPAPRVQVASLLFKCQESVMQDDPRSHALLLGWPCPFSDQNEITTRVNEINYHRMQQSFETDFMPKKIFWFGGREMGWSLFACLGINPLTWLHWLLIKLQMNAMGLTSEDYKALRCASHKMMTELVTQVHFYHFSRLCLPGHHPLNSKKYFQSQPWFQRNLLLLLS